MQGRFRTGDQALIREMNLSTVLRCCRENAPMSRSSLSVVTGLNKTTISSLVEELLDRGLVHEIGQQASSGGRRATLLELDPEAGCIVGVALGVDFVSVALADFVGGIRWRRLVDADPTESQDAIMTLTRQVVDEAISVNESLGTRLLGLGMATPGTVNLDKGLLVFSPNLQWHNVPYVEIFEEHTGLPVIVDNDANAAALAEHLFGVARHAQDFVCVYAGVGIGGGLFLNGELYRGATGFAGEIGHTKFLLEHYRRPCRCGSRGCWETSVAQDSVLERVRTRLAVGRESLVRQLMNDRNSPLTLSIIIEAAHAGDAEAREALIETGSLLGYGVASLVSIFNPEVVVIGGPLCTAGDYLLSPVQEAIEETVLPEIREQVEVCLSAFGAEASVMGAVALVVDDILAHPNRVDRRCSQAL